MSEIPATRMASRIENETVLEGLRLPFSFSRKKGLANTPFSHMNRLPSPQRRDWYRKQEKNPKRISSTLLTKSQDSFILEPCILSNSHIPFLTNRPASAVWPWRNSAHNLAIKLPQQASNPPSISSIAKPGYQASHSHLHNRRGVNMRGRVRSTTTMEAHTSSSFDLLWFKLIWFLDGECYPVPASRNKEWCILIPKPNNRRSTISGFGPLDFTESMDVNKTPGRHR